MSVQPRLGLTIYHIWTECSHRTTRTVLPAESAMLGARGAAVDRAVLASLWHTQCSSQ